MPHLNFPSRRLRQPSGPVRVTATWLNRGLVASFTPSAGFVDLARNNNASGIVGNITNVAGSQGRAWAGAYQGSNNYVLIPRTNDLAYTSGVTFEALITVNAFQTNVFPYISGVISQAHEPSWPPYFGPVLRFNSTGSVGDAAQPVFFVSQSGVEKQATGAAQSTNVPIHLIGLYNGANSVLWVNGVKTVGAAVTGSVDNNINNFITLLSDYVGASNAHNRCLNGNLYFANIYNRGLTDTESLDRYLFPWGYLRPDPRRIYFGAGSVGDTYSLTASALAGSSPTLGSGVLTQEHTLAATGLAGAAPTLQSLALAQDHAVTASNVAGSAPTLGTPALTLAGTLIANDIAGSAPVLQLPALTQNHSLTATGIACTAPTLQAPAMTQAHTIVASNLTSAAPTLGAPALSASGDSYALAANAITGSAPALALAVLVQDHSLTATAILGSSPVLSSPAFGQQHLLTGSNIVAGTPTAGTPGLTSGTSGGTGATVEEIVAALQAAVLPVDIRRVNAVPLAGVGTNGDPWRAA